MKGESLGSPASAEPRLLDESALTSPLSASAREFVRLEGLADRMVEETLAAYRRLFPDGRTDNLPRESAHPSVRAGENPINS